MIVRNEHRKQFTKVDTELARNGTFRPEELGLYVTMLSHTDNWDFHEKALARELGTTPEEIRAILLRLEMKGFAVSRTGRYGVTWDLIEKPEEIKEDEKFPPQEEDGIWIVKQTPLKRHDAGEEYADASQDQKEEQTLTSDEMAQAFFKKAEELRRIGMQRRSEQERACRTRTGKV